MPRRPLVREFVDWTGGLNYLGDAFTLAENQVVDCLNVQLLPRGGFQRRKTACWTNDVPFADGRNVWAYYGSAPHQILVQDGSSLLFSTDGASTFETAYLGSAIEGRMRSGTLACHSGASAGVERCYVQRDGERLAFRWDGTSATTMADPSASSPVGWNDNIEAPAYGQMPVARYVCSHAGMLFHAGTVEGPSEARAPFPARLRWSHPGEPEDYRADDVVDVGGDGEPITGLASFGRNLFVFKRKSVWVLSGYSPDTFQLAQISSAAGAVSQEAIVVAPNGLFFFDPHDGIFMVSPSGDLRWMWADLAVMLSDGRIPASYVSQVTCGWMDQRLWVSVPWDGSDTNQRMFVFDPLLGKVGGWYQYAFGNWTPAGWLSNGVRTFGIGPMVEFRPSNGPIGYFGMGAGGKRVYQFEYDHGDGDLAGPEDFRPFSSGLQTAWYRVGVAGAQKRFRRPRFVLDAASAASVNVRVLRDFEPSAPQRSMTLRVKTKGGGEWGDPTFVWGSSEWGVTSEQDQAIVRGRAIGSAYAVSFLFEGDMLFRFSEDGSSPYTWGGFAWGDGDWFEVRNGVPRWGVNAIDLVYLPRAVR